MIPDTTKKPKQLNQTSHGLISLLWHTAIL